MGVPCISGCQCRRHSNGRSPRSVAHRRAISLALIGIKRSEETKKRMSIATRRNPPKPMLGKTHSVETRQLISQIQKRRWCSQQSRQRASETSKALWDDPERVRRMTRGSGNINKPESILLKLIEPLGFWYTGGGPDKVVISRMVPDFCNRYKAVVELYGDYWHRGQDPQDRIDRYLQSGHRCLVVWESELYNSPSQVVTRVKEYVGIDG